MRLIRSSDRGSLRAEDPYIATQKVRNALMLGRHALKGLDELQRTSYITKDSEIIDAVQKGDWLLVPDERSPASASSFMGLSEESNLVYINEDRWPDPKPRTDLIFAKSCTPDNWGKTYAGTVSEPASNFGKVMLSGTMPLPASATAFASSLGADAALGRMAGGGIMQGGLTWLLRTGAATPVGVFVLGMLPTTMGDGTLHTDDQLRNMDSAPTRVRFQFRRDGNGVLQVYGIHSSAESGDDTVRTVQAQWNADKTAMEANLNGITILWTPQKGPRGIPALTYPDNSGEQIGTILVHPIPENTDTEIEGYPVDDDVTLGDYILVFPADTGLKSLYVVFSKPFGGDHSYHPAPKGLTAFPDAVKVDFKTRVQGGGGARKRWKDQKGRIYEWDSQHGTVEMYDKQGWHLGEFDPVTGEQTKSAKPGRKVEK